MDTEQPSFSLTLTGPEVDLLLTGLAELPYKHSASTIQAIQSQARQQLAEKEQGTEPVEESGES